MIRFSMRPLWRAGLVTLTAVALGTTAGAQTAGTSGCTALYATTSTYPGVTSGGLYFVGNDGAPTPVAALPTGAGVNGAALDPVTGNVYYIDRTGTGTPTQNDLRVFNPNTRTDTLVTRVTPPTGADNTLVGATFDNSTGTSRLFLLYGTYQVQEITTGGTVLRTHTINLPTTDSAGRAITKPTTTSGDFVFENGILYATIDATNTANSTTYVYYINLGAPPTSGTGSAITPTPANVIRMGNGTATNPFPEKSVVGVAINPVTKLSYVASNIGGTRSIGTFDRTTGIVTALNVPPITYTDLSDCNVAPALPVLSKAFGATTIRTGETTSLTITISNANPSAYYTQATIVDTLPAGVVVASTPNLTTTCILAGGGAGTTGAIVNAGGTSVTIPDDLRIPTGGCRYTLNVTGTTRGAKTNVINATTVNTTAGKPAANATANLLVNDPATATVVKTQRLIPVGSEAATTATTTPLSAQPGRTIEYCITATHGGVGYADATKAVIGDVLSNNLELVPNTYNGGISDVSIQRGAATPTYAKFATTFASVTTNGVTQQVLSVNILPFNASNSTVTVCFQARVR